MICQNNVNNVMHTNSIMQTDISRNNANLQSILQFIVFREFSAVLFHLMVEIVDGIFCREKGKERVNSAQISTSQLIKLAFGIVSVKEGFLELTCRNCPIC